MSLNRTDQEWVISKIEPHVATRLKQLFPVIPRGMSVPFRLKHTVAVDTDLDWFMQRYPLKMSDRDELDLAFGRKQYLRNQAELERILLPDYVPTAAAKFNDGFHLRPYQVQAVEVQRLRQSLLLGDDMGLGKTIQAIGFLATEPKSLPAVVVCDAHMQPHWKEKIQSFTNLKVHLIKTRKSYSLPKADVYVYRISQVSGWSDVFAEDYFQSVIFDEPQSLRNGRSTSKGRACYTLSKHVQYRMGLTATPINGYGGEIWHVMQMIDESILGDWLDFIQEWCQPVGSRGKYSVKNPKALGSYLREQGVFLRRTKQDVGQQLPKVERIVEYIEYDESAVAAVEDLARTLAIKSREGKWEERGSAIRELDMMVRQATGVSKAKTVAAYARMIIEAGEPIVLWGWHRECYRIWLEELADLNPAMYTGSESAVQKEKAKKRFLKGETDLLIMSLRSGAGVDGLQFRCCTGIYGELDWSPQVHLQCGGRLDRDGQLKPVTLFYLVVDEGSDPPIMDVLAVKASESKGIVDPHLGIEISEPDTDRLQKLVERYLNRKSK